MTKEKTFKPFKRVNAGPDDPIYRSGLTISSPGAGLKARKKKTTEDTKGTKEDAERD